MFTSEITVEFTPLPKEMEEVYWAALNYFAEVMLSEMQKFGKKWAMYSHSILCIMTRKPK